MRPDDGAGKLAQFEAAVAALGDGPYELTLFVSGASDSSARAIVNVREICDTHLGGRHVLKIIDVNQEPDAAGEHHILATPTLVKGRPLPLRMLVGDMSDHPRILVSLDVPAADAPDGT